MKLPKKIALTAAAGFLFHLGFAQSVQEGIQNVDSHKFGKAREIYNTMISSSPKDADNYFYLGNTYITQFEPNFSKAEEYFKKGLEINSKNYLNKIGLASIKLGKGDKSAITEIQNIVKDSREKDTEVLYRAAEALTMYEKNNAPDLAIDYLNKAIEKAQKNGIPAHFYYTLGDAYRLKKDAGKAMTAYDNAASVARNKASVFTRMASLWMAAQQWQQAKQNIDKAISADPSYAPVYKVKAAYDIRYQQNQLATQDLINYAKYADEDPYTQLEIAKLFFTNEDYTNSKATLNKVFDKVDDVIKFKLKAYLDYADGEYASAKQNMENFISKAEKERIQPSDQGLLGLIDAGLAKDEKDEAKKQQLLTESKAKIAIAKNAKDTTLKWDEELIKLSGSSAANEAAANAGPSSPEIEDLKKKVAANPQDTDALFKLANAYQNVKNWNGAAFTWQKMINLLPDWAPAYYSQGYAYQQAKNNEMAKLSYENYISKITPAEVAANKEPLSYAYFAVAYMVKDSDQQKAKAYVDKSLELNRTYQDAINLNQQLNSSNKQLNK
ncbi:tetratricopeptide repeat protein [Bergeyella cardium]|uniref:Uncharacterized protein n=1 Tax=Bergeyella cardium TaxID=1585976 RepID=A0A6P1QTK2_9FLAO|nr:tetratricopeptide repeat protein [Bergeyella cardium]QHN65015.1 hypothetical protein DBX24_03435 [Bergeyella cardium]WHE34330.1 hypothetical protein P8603_03465 [Bergeyella cardium]WHF60981.1 hypothetical protein O0R51_03460 [Bergeyella cardium]